MKNNIHKIGAILFILLGIGHLVTYFSMRDQSTFPDLLQQMNENKVQFPLVERSVMQLHEGFSIMMGFLLIAFGGLHLSISQSLSSKNLKKVLLFNSLIALIGLLLSINFFFIVPVSFLGISFLVFAYSYVKQQVVAS